MLPEADPQVPVRTDFRDQAGDRGLDPPKVLYAPPQPHTLSRALLIVVYFLKSATFFPIPPGAPLVMWVHWNLEDA